MTDSFTQVERGFHNWKDSTIAFRNHERCASHKEAVEVIITLLSTTKDIGEHLSHQHATLKANSQQALYQILTSLRYLCSRVYQSEEMEMNQMAILINCCN